MNSDRLEANGVLSAADIAVLGMTHYRKPGPKTVAAKLAGVQKRAKRRAAK